MELFNIRSIGLLSLCTTNLPEPTMGIPQQDGDHSDDNHNVVTYDGTGSSQAITGVGSIDWIWIKKRDGGTSRNHIITDTTRGVTKHLSTVLTDEFTNTNGVTAFGTDGFTVGSYDSVNESGNDDRYVERNWKANGGV